MIQISSSTLLLQGVILLDTHGESCDGEASEEDGEPLECSNNFVFVGAEIKTGKSSIRSKQKPKKVRPGSHPCNLLNSYFPVCVVLTSSEHSLGVPLLIIDSLSLVAHPLH